MSQGSSGGKQRRSYDEQTIHPVTIRMALAAQTDATQDGNLLLDDGRKLYHVKIVGAVRSVEEHSTNALYEVEDGTGLIDVKRWVVDEEESSVAALREKTKQDNIYVKVVGEVKDYEGKKMIVAKSIRPLSTGNELAHHMLDVVYSAQKAKRANQPMPMMSNSGVGFGGSVGGAPLEQAANNNGTGNEVADLVMKFYVEESTHLEIGASVQACYARLGGKFSEAQIRAAIDALSGEGRIYSTIDDDHFKFAAGS